MKTYMPWQQAGISWDAFEQAMDQCDCMGRDAFRQEAHQGFKAAKGKGVMHGLRGPYEPRPLVAAAYTISYPSHPRLGPKDFSGDSARQYLIRYQGFTLAGEKPASEREPVALAPEPEQVVTLNGVSYPLSLISEAGRKALAKLKETETSIQQVQRRLAIHQTARAVYAQALSGELLKQKQAANKLKAAAMP